MAAVATTLTSHALKMGSEADAEGDIDDQLQFTGQSELPPSRKPSIEILRGQNDAGSAAAFAEDSTGIGHPQSHSNGSAHAEAMPNGQLEGAADEDIAADSGSESDRLEEEEESNSSSDEEGSAAAAAWEANSAEEASLEHATRNNCMYADPCLYYLRNDWY